MVIDLNAKTVVSDIFQEKILSINVRGFGVSGKFGWVKGLCLREKPDIAVFQETKCRKLDDLWVQHLWGNSDFGYIQKEAVGNSGGLLVIWDTNRFKKDLSISALDRRESDHCPLILRDGVIDFGPKPFKIFDVWLFEEGVDKIIQEGWCKDVHGFKKDCIFRDKLKNVKGELKRWSQKEFGKLDEEIDTLKDIALKWELKAEFGTLSDGDRLCWLESRKNWIAKEKIKMDMLKQKARVRWTLEGDKNSKFFHSTMRRKFNKNNIRGLINDGIWCEDPKEIKANIFEHFKNIFCANQVHRPSFLIHGGSNRFSLPADGLSFGSVGTGPHSIGPGLVRPAFGADQATVLEQSSVGTGLGRLSNISAALLEEKFTEEEVWVAIKGCGSSKAPSPDGFNLRFHKNFWHLIKDELMGAIHDFWVSGKISNGCNASFITLVPKKSDPSALNDYRPISLIGSYYKVISKLLSNRLRRVIPNLVSFEQSAFIKGRNILDGSLIANESLDFIKHTHSKSLIFKVDFEKAFDCLSWDFLLEVMEIMGFGAK
ncbi:uncharacterized protein [Rutidosis leptorrhynchoides]|uniref:uncharacterized protein n=1 Tax=Rutidosis leptorrhynchoides TaxID=125765 RepID=UPI003A99B064